MQRIWNGKDNDHGAIHALGNGRLLIYGQGPDLAQIVGPPYSSPSLAALRFVAPTGSRVLSTRRPGAAIWDHRWEQDGQEQATWTDAVDPEHPVYVRQIRTRVPMILEWDLALGWSQSPPSSIYADGPGQTSEGWTAGGVLVRLAGTYLLLTLPMMTPAVGRFACRGQVQLVPPRWAGDCWRLHLAPGQAELLLATGSSVQDCHEALSAAMSLGSAGVLERSHAHWQAFTAQRPALPDAVRAVGDDIAVMIAAQQGREGGVLAGHRYHTDYLRDAYGVGRGLLALGHHAQALAILEYYRDIFERTGLLTNSQTVGGVPQFQRNEHDEAEGPALVILQIFDLAAAVQDPELPRRYLPLLTWGWQAMTRLLCNQMLPFSGDETYIAGQILSRAAVEHGSAEGTALFLRAGGLLLPWLRQRGLWDASTQAAAEEVLAQCRAAYPGHFIRNGRLITNQPSREAALTPQLFRRGFCQDCSVDGTRKNWLTYGVHKRSAQGRYLCPSCHARPDPVPAEIIAPQTIPSVSLVGPYLGFDLIRPEELRPGVEELLPVLLGDLGQSTRLVGYDAGLLLFCLDALEDPRAAQAAQALLALRDPTGAWVEYYDRGQPVGCRARPWESGVNIAALIEHYQRHEIAG